MADVNNPIADLSIDELIKLAENPIDQYRSDSAAASEKYKPYREGLGSFSQFLDKGLALPFYAGKQISGGISDALGFGSEFFGKDKLAANFRRSADIDQADASALLNKGLTGSIVDGASNIFSGPEAGIDDSLLNERFMDFVPTAGFEGELAQEMSTEEEMMGMPAPVGGMSNAERVQEALFGAIPAFEKSGRGDAPVKEERFFTGEGKPKPGEMMDTDFLNTFEEALLDTGESKGDKVTPETKEDLLAKYKKEFYDATGLDSSGKVDKSAALMALGISLMQNTAGSKFNVGKMLASVGEAGEKALPELTKAKDKAAAAEVAAGKYALGQIQAGKSASAALAKEERLHDRAVELAQEERRNELADKKREGIEIKGGYFDERLKGLKVRMANTNSGSVFANPESALNKVNDRLKATNGGLETVDIMLDLANNIVNKKSPSLSLVVDRANSAFSGFGIVDPDLVFGEKGMSDEDNLKALQDSLITRYKKFLTQETGNGISNTDVERLQKLLGKIDLIGNPATSLVRLEEVRQIFMSERRKVRNVADELMDPNFYQTPEIYERMNFNKFLNEKQNYSIVTPGDSTTPRIKV